MEVTLSAASSMPSGHDAAHKGVNGYITAVGATNGRQAGESGGFEFGTDRWLFWANGGGQRSGDYDSPIGEVPNSFSREGNVGTESATTQTKAFSVSTTISISGGTESRLTRMRRIPKLLN